MDYTTYEIFQDPLFQDIQFQDPLIQDILLQDTLLQGTLIQDTLILGTVFHTIMGIHLTCIHLIHNLLQTTLCTTNQRHNQSSFVSRQLPAPVGQTFGQVCYHSYQSLGHC